MYPIKLLDSLVNKVSSEIQSNSSIALVRRNSLEKQLRGKFDTTGPIIQRISSSNQSIYEYDSILCSWNP
ncbi:putative HTH-type transcriptional regulator SinR [Dirofilaria immitis]